MQTCLLTHLLVLCRRSPSLASVKSRLVLPFWYRLTWVVPDRGPLNVCVCVAGVGGVVGSCVVAWVRRRLRPVLQRVVPEVRYARCWQQRRRSGGDRRPPRRLQTKSVGVVVVFTVARTRSSTLPSTSAAELLVHTTATQRGQQRSVCHTATPSRRKNEPVFFCVRLFQYLTETRMHPFNGPLSGTTWDYQKGKTNLDFTEARDNDRRWQQLGNMQVAPRSSQITVPALHHSVFYRPDALPAAQPTASKH